MMKKRLFLAIFSLIFVACNNSLPELPTAVPAAQIPTETPIAAPTATNNLPPTTDLTTLNPTQEPTTVPTKRPTLTPTPINEIINITTPNDDAELTLGTEVEARGLLQIDAGQSIWVDLFSANGRLLASVQGSTGDIGWEATVTIPEFVSGIGYLRASIQENSEIIAQNQIQVGLIPNIEEAESFLLLLRPQEDDRAVEGFNFFFDGRVFRPTDSTVTVSIWADNCQTQVAKQSFVLGNSSRSIYWQGFTIPPRDSAGDACAVASFGEPETEMWREAVMPITIYPANDREAKGITIGNPPANATYFAGGEIFIYGTAFNESEGTIRVSLLLENGRVIFDGEVTTDFWGYWELTILLPPDAEGPAELTAFTEPDDPDFYVEYKTPILIEPAPTPTPIP